MGNASEVDAAKVQAELAPLLLADERVAKAYQLVRDTFLFTDRRLILVNRQGITGHKVEYESIPYRSIAQFSVQTAGHVDRDAELRLWIVGVPAPRHLEFSRKLDIHEVQRVLAGYVLMGGPSHS
jgi:hypothetical protein